MQPFAIALLLLSPAEKAIDIPKLQLGVMALSKVRARVSYRDGAVMLDEFTARIPTAGKVAALSGNGYLRVTPPILLSLRLRAEGIDLAALERLPPEFRPPLRLTGVAQIDATAEGSWRQRTFGLRGTVRIAETAIEKLRLGATEFRFALSADHLRVDIVRARVAGGEVAGSASLPLRVTERGTLDLTLNEVEVAQAVKALSGPTLPLKGRVTGAVKGTITAAMADQERDLRAVVDVAGPNLRIRNVPTQRLRGHLRFREGRVEYELAADTLGARVPLAGQFPPPRRR